MHRFIKIVVSVNLKTQELSSKAFVPVTVSKIALFLFQKSRFNFLCLLVCNLVANTVLMIRNAIPIHGSSRSQLFYKMVFLKNFTNIHRKTSVLKSPFNKVAGQSAFPFLIFFKGYRQVWGFTEKRLKHICFPVNF